MIRRSARRPGGCCRVSILSASQVWRRRKIWLVGLGCNGTNPGSDVVLPDVNVLVYAFRSDVLEHAAAIGWLRDAMSDDEFLGLSPLVLGAVVRITTNPRVFGSPSPLED